MSKKLTISMLCVLQPVHFLVPGDHPSPLVSISFLIILAVPSKQAFFDGSFLPSSPAFFRYRWSLLLTVPRATITIGTGTTF